VGFLPAFFDLYIIFKEFCDSILYVILRTFLSIRIFSVTFWLQCPANKIRGLPILFANNYTQNSPSLNKVVLSSRGVLQKTSQFLRCMSLITEISFLGGGLRKFIKSVVMPYNVFPHDGRIRVDLINSVSITDIHSAPVSREGFSVGLHRIERCPKRSLNPLGSRKKNCKKSEAYNQCYTTPSFLTYFNRIKISSFLVISSKNRKNPT
jgi:hypothetical protein